MKFSFVRLLFGALAIFPASLAFRLVTNIVDEVRLNANHTSTLGTIGGPSWVGHGVHYYTFVVDGVTYHGSSAIEDPSHSFGQTATVYYVPTSPRVSSMLIPSNPDPEEVIFAGVFVVVLSFVTARVVSFSLRLRKLPEPFRSWVEWDFREGEQAARPNAAQPPDEIGRQ